MIHFGKCRHDEAKNLWNENCKLTDHLIKAETEIEGLKKHSAWQSELIKGQEKALLGQIEQIKNGSLGYEKLKKQHHFALEKIKHLQEVIADLNKQNKVINKAPLLFTSEDGSRQGIFTAIPTLKGSKSPKSLKTA
jgi:hypothetical protein